MRDRLDKENETLTSVRVFQSFTHRLSPIPTASLATMTSH